METARWPGEPKPTADPAGSASASMESNAAETFAASFTEFIDSLRTGHTPSGEGHFGR